MISLHSVLAGGIIDVLPTIFVIVAITLLVLAFTMGFVKGFRKVGWDGLMWLAASLLFLLLNSLLPEGAILSAAFTASIIMAVLSVAAALVGFGVLASFIRPKVRWVKDNVNGDTSLAEYGLEFEPEYLDYDGENDVMPYGKMIYKTGFNPPNVVGRLLGGVACMVTVAMILWAVAGVAMLAVDATSLKTMGYEIILKGKFAEFLLMTAKKYLLDCLAIGITLFIAKRGYYTGFMSSLRTLILTIGGTAGIGFAFYLPFSKFAYRTDGLWTFLNKLAIRCYVALDGKGGAFNAILSKLLAGVVIAAIVCVLLVLLNLLLTKCCKMVSSSGPSRLADACAACLFYAVLGAAIIVAAWFVLATLDFFMIININEVIQPTAHLSNGLFRFTGLLLDKVMTPLLNFKLF